MIENTFRYKKCEFTRVSPPLQIPERMEMRDSQVLYRRLLTIGGFAAGLLLTGIAQADVFTFDTTLASPNTNAATGNPNTGAGSGNNPSWYNGTGNPQGGWTVSTGSGIEIGLRAKYRNVDSVIHTSDDDYSVLIGGCTTPACTGGGAAHPNYALWNYEFSIDLRPNGVGTLTLADIATNTILTVTDSEGHTASINPLTHWGDDTGFGSGLDGANGVTSTGKHKPETTTDWGVQNSENLGFGDSPLNAFFNPNASDTYSFQLQVINNAGTVLATDDMEVQATPEPSAVILFGTLLTLVLAGVRRKLHA